MLLGFKVIAGLAIVIVGLVGFYFWFHGDLSSDDGYGVFMLSVVAVFAGIQIMLRSVGIDVFGRDGSSDSGTSLFDGDGDGGD